MTANTVALPVEQAAIEFAQKLREGYLNSEREVIRLALQYASSMLEADFAEYDRDDLLERVFNSLFDDDPETGSGSYGSTIYINAFAKFAGQA